MSDGGRPLSIGSIAWTDLTVPDADLVRDFYREIAGWEPTPVPMGGYEDYVMQAADGSAVGVCHARGENADLPPQWLIYITVEDVDRSAERCVALGGAMVVRPRPMGSQRVCVIADPAGAVCALISGEP